MRLATLVACWIGATTCYFEFGSIGPVRIALSSLLTPGLETSGPYLLGWAAHMLTTAALFLLSQAGFYFVGDLSAGCLLGKGSRRKDILVVLPLGWGVTALASFGIALAGLAFRPVLLAGGLACLAGVWLVLRNRRAIAESLGEFLVLEGSRLVIGGLIFVCVLALAAFAPELDGDVINYHFGTPWQVLRLHKLVEWPFTIFDDYPPLWEMLMLPMLGTAGEGVARLFGPLLLLFIGAITIRLASLVLPRPWAAVAAMLAVTSPFLGTVSLIAKNDLLVCVYALLAIETALKPAPGGSGGLFLCGLMSGFLFVTKYTGGIVPPVIICVALFYSGLTLRKLAGLAAGLLAVSAPMLLKNYFMTGDPLYPFAWFLFDSPFTSAKARLRMVENQTYVTIQDPKQMNLWVKVRTVTGNYPFQEDCFARWLALMPALLAVKAWSRELKALAVAALLLFAGWVLSPALARFGIFLFPLGYLLATVGLSVMGKTGRTLAGVVLTLQALHSLGSLKYLESIKAATGLVFSDKYVERERPTYLAATRAVNEHVPEGGRLLVVGGALTGWLRPRVDSAAFAGTAMPAFKLVHESWTEADLAKKFRQFEWSHVLYNAMNAFFWRRTFADDDWSERDLELWGKFWSHHASVEWESGTENAAEGYFYLLNINKDGHGDYRGVLPGLEGWTHLLFEEARGERIDEALMRVSGLRRTVGYFGSVDYTVWAFLQKVYPDRKCYELLEHAARRGYGNSAMFTALSYYAEKLAMPGKAEYWMNKAMERDPSLNREAFLREILGR